MIKNNEGGDNLAISMEGNFSNLRKPREEFNDVETRKQKIGGDRNKTQDVRRQCTPFEIKYNVDCLKDF